MKQKTYFSLILYTLMNSFGLHICISAVNESHQIFVVTKLDINTDVRYRFSETKYKLTVYNPSNERARYLANIPFYKEAFISNFTIEKDGETVVSNVVAKRNSSGLQAISDFNEAESSQFKLGKVTNSFIMPVDIEPKNDVTMTLTYQEVLRRQKGVYGINIILGQCDNAYNTNFKLSLTETKPLTNLLVDPAWEGEQNIKDLKLMRPSNESAIVTYKTVSNKIKCLQALKVEYDVQRNPNAGEILIEDGFFVHFLAPTGLQSIPKDIVFVLDTSKSMTGEPIAELQDAMASILDKLEIRDRFNIIVFQTSFGMFESELQNVSREIIARAKNMINFMSPEGGTNIHDGLLAGLKMLHLEEASEIRSPIIIFLTDGQASSGVTNNDLITARVHSRNILGIPIFSISLGKEADTKLASKIASQNFGISRHIFDAGKSSTIINSLYDDVASTIMKHINIVYLDNAVNNRTVTQTKFRTLFNQSEIVTSGKLYNETETHINTTVIGLSTSGITVLTNASVSVIDDDSEKNVIEEIWKYRRVKEVIGIKNAIDDPTVVQALDDTLLAMSLEYNYLTPLTTFLVDRDGKIHGTSVVDNDKPVSDKTARQVNDTPQRQERPRRTRFTGKGDPHFEVTMRGIEYPACFEIMTEPGSILRILQISKDVIVNIGIINETTIYRNDKMYISDIFASATGHSVLLNINSGIIYKDILYHWPSVNCSELVIGRLSMCKDNFYNKTTFQLYNDVFLQVDLVVHAEKTYFNIKIEQWDLLPVQSNGLLGKIINKDFKLQKVFKRNGKIVGSISVKSRGSNEHSHFSAVLREKNRSSSGDLCWSLHKHINGFINSIEHYQLKSLFHSDGLS